MAEAKYEAFEEVKSSLYNDIRDAEYLNLTTIRQPLYESGMRGVELLLELIETPIEEPQEIMLDLELVIRETTSKNHPE